jgi:hypothetical protein
MSESSLIRPDAGWVLSLYPKAGEAGGRSSPRRPVRTYVAGTPAADPERARQEAGRRARRKVRLYCAEHGLNRLGTLTYAGEGCHNPQQLRRDVAEFFRNLRAALGGEAFPYVWVPEWHKSDHGLHVHFAIGGFVPRNIIDAARGSRVRSHQAVGSPPYRLRAARPSPGRCGLLVEVRLEVLRAGRLCSCAGSAPLRGG